ncbi:MAG TPA: AAA family ATPase [Actinomycetota bacterium]|nr:AAA family ATPase [Actinomycetota bacterium]
MVLDPSVRAALETALAANPGDIPVRLHLAGLLVTGGEAEAALAHCTTVLAAQPDNQEALRLAGIAAGALGDPRAAGYERLLAALQGPHPAPAPPNPVSNSPHPAPAPPDPVSDSPHPAIHPPEAQRVPVADSLPGEEAVDAFIAEVLASDPDVERPTITLADVGGLVEVKRRLETSFLGPMRNPELRRLYGKSLRGGLLLYGPPGCGKTFLARAVAGELGARFFGIGLHDVLDMWLGKSERNLHEVFETARRNSPCVLFLDEVDALGMKRTNLAHSAGRGVVVQLLSELDSTRADNEGVFVLGATNQPWDIDPALRRPGRFDRTLLVLPPDAPARASILEFHMRQRPVGKLDFGKLAEATPGYSGADLRLVCESASELALEESMRKGAPRPIEARDFDGALREVAPSTRPWFEVARNYAQFANEGGAYDDLLAYMRTHRLV